MDVSLEGSTSIAFRIQLDRNTLLSQALPNMLIPAENGRSSSVADDAFRAVRGHFERTTSLSKREKKLVTGTACLKDVQQALAKLAFVCVKKGSNLSKTREWLQMTHDALKHYATVLDVFDYNHSDHVALAWGIFQLMYSALDNHAETIQLLAKATVEIATRLPQIEHLSRLYAINQMRAVIDSLYCCILEFLVSGYSWRNESNFRHFHQSFTWPHELHFHDLLSRVADLSKIVTDLATSGSHGEMDIVHASRNGKLEDILHVLEAADQEREDQQRGLTQVVSLLGNYSGTPEQKMDIIFSLLHASGQTVVDLLAKTNTLHYLHSSSRLDTNMPLQQAQLMGIMSSILSAFEDPEITHRYHLFLRNWRATRTGSSSSTNQFWRSPKLAQWSSSDKSSIVVIKGPFKSRGAILDFSTSLIQTLTVSKMSTAWALKRTEKATSTDARALSPTDLVKYLLRQILRLSSTAPVTVYTEKQVTLCRSQFQEAKTLRDWFALLEQAVTGFSGRQVYLVIDLAAVRADLEPDLNLFRELHQLLADSSGGDTQSSSTRIKILLLLYEADWYGRVPKELHDQIVLAKMLRLKNPRQRKEMQKAVSVRVLPASRDVHGAERERGRF
ncbi:hypothetical protein QBC34DRAFT_406790 [Podospora aff. communis PSN243]|uniref:DUF7708 domain-containing protein n=1 Tax=Podospora aff. communis PSN243 TaxID=3040156 RepID=A0AAV9GM34_9PEZI|nr:hypothetical protein QBC34DRAFT_406790 [Podospora aff. communis PSN243]